MWKSTPMPAGVLLTQMRESRRQLGLHTRAWCTPALHSDRSESWTAAYADARIADEKARFPASHTHQMLRIRMLSGMPLL
jgi:hypothetical protein